MEDDATIQHERTVIHTGRGAPRATSSRGAGASRGRACSSSSWARTWRWTYPSPPTACSSTSTSSGRTRRHTPAARRGAVRLMESPGVCFSRRRRGEDERRTCAQNHAVERGRVDGVRRRAGVASMACRSRFSHGSAATFDLCTALGEGAVAPTAFVIDLVRAKALATGTSLNSWDCRRTLIQRPPARRTRTVSFLSSAALWIWLLKINKNDARSAAFSVPSTSRFFSAGSLIPGANSTRASRDAAWAHSPQVRVPAWEFQRSRALSKASPTCLHKSGTSGSRGATRPPERRGAWRKS